jgi:acetyl-CoA carboxylase carboxyltransferase component
MFITGPEVIKAVTGEEVDLETLGGAMTHSTVSGVAHFAADDEDHALDLTRTLLGYLPSNNTEPPPAVEPGDDPWRMDPELNTIVPADPSQAYSMKSIIRKVFDLGSFLRCTNIYQNALVRLPACTARRWGDGPTTMILAGVIDIDAADRMAGLSVS